MPKVIGLLGAHRVGKSYLRDHLTAVLGTRNFDYSISRETRNLGYNSSNQSYGAHLRKYIQEHLLKSMRRSLRNQTTYLSPASMDYTVKELIADRTPIDLIGYAVVNLAKSPPSQSNRDWLKWYIDECIELTNKYFSNIVLIQPGIPFVPDDKSGPIEMVDELNAVYLSMLLKPELAVPKRVMPEAMTDITERMKYVLEFINA